MKIATFNTSSFDFKIDLLREGETVALVCCETVGVPNDDDDERPGGARGRSSVLASACRVVLSLFLNDEGATKEGGD